MHKAWHVDLVVDWFSMRGRRSLSFKYPRFRPCFPMEIMFILYGAKWTLIFVCPCLTLFVYRLPAYIFNVLAVILSNPKIVLLHRTLQNSLVCSQSLLLFIIIICLRGWIFLMWLYPCNVHITENSRLLRNDAYSNSSPAKPANALPFLMPAVCYSTLHAYKQIS